MMNADLYDHSGFRLRGTQHGTQVRRLETFVDAAFAITWLAMLWTVSL
jgi:hypothetical protein